jgi:hypothetical protein
MYEPNDKLIHKCKEAPLLLSESIRSHHWLNLYQRYFQREGMNSTQDEWWDQEVFEVCRWHELWVVHVVLGGFSLLLSNAKPPFWCKGMMQMPGCKIIAIQYTMIRAFKSKFFILLRSMYLELLGLLNLWTTPWLSLQLVLAVFLSHS